MWRTLFIGVLAIDTEAFDTAPIRCGGPSSKKFILASQPNPLRESDTAPLHLRIGYPPDRSSSNIVPYFSAQLDNTITWDTGGRRWCMEASGFTSGQEVRVNRCTGGSKQRWRWLPWGPIQLKGTNQCLDIVPDNAGGSNGAPIELRDCDNKKASELWKFEHPIPNYAESYASGARDAMVILVCMAAVGTLSVGAWLRRWQGRAHTDAVSLRGTTARGDHGGGIHLTAPFVARDGRTTLIDFSDWNGQSMVPAVMAQSLIQAGAQGMPNDEMLDAAVVGGGPSDIGPGASSPPTLAHAPVPQFAHASALPSLPSNLCNPLPKDWTNGIELWICLDFEWTCDEGPEQAFSSEEAEIIEFSFVVYDTRAVKGIAEGQYYIKPERTPVTDFCTELTGISDATLADAGSFADALRRFEEVMNAPALVGRSCCAVTHGSYDLEFALAKNCRACGLTIPNQLRKYVDLRDAAQRHVFRSKKPFRRASSLREICSVLGVEMYGQEHCGLDDSWSVLMSLQQLLKEGATLIAVDLDAESNNFFMGGQQHLCLDGLGHFAFEPEVRQWITEKTQQPFPEGSLYTVLAPEGGLYSGQTTGRAIADFGNDQAAMNALRALETGKRLVCGCWDGAPYSRRERMILTRPLRCQETEVSAKSLVPMPATPQAMKALRPRWVKKRKKKGGKKGGKKKR